MNVTKEQQIALSILIGFGLVAASIFATGFNVRTLPVFASVLEKFQVELQPERTVAKERRIYGDVNAGITLVEFSDFQCPYCSQLHTTLKQLVDESEGTINWEYRHFPLPIHNNANISALYAECVGVQKGDELFWKFSDILMDNQRNLDETFLKTTALSMDVDEGKLASCVKSKKTQDTVDEDMRVAQAFGGSGTPFTVIVYKDGTTKVVSGALPYTQWIPLLK